MDDDYRQYRYYYKQYRKAVETLPEYIRKNLNEMTSNKGYIWRGCYFFGKIPSKYDYPMVFFEKRGGVLKIHECTPTDYFIYEKKGTDKKKLTSHTVRKPIRHSFFH